MSNNIHYKGRIYIGCRMAQEATNTILPGFDNEVFHAHLATLVSYPYTGTNLKDGQVVAEGVDYELDYRVAKGDVHDSVSAAEYHQSPELPSKRIVAIPKEQPTEKKEETQEELWNEALLLTNPDSALQTDINNLSKKFTITRK